jgi:hypothetical protein
MKQTEVKKMKFLMKLVSACLVATIPFTSAFAEVFTLQYCEVSASGSMPEYTPAAFDGSFTDDGVDFLFDWTHSYPGGEFEAVTADPVNTYCRLNGLISAEAVGSGTFNGLPGYYYSLRIEDNRAAPSRIVLSASITTSPTRRSEGVTTFGAPTPVIIPFEIPVTGGASGPGWTRLHLDEVITCRYRGMGSSYAFERCTGAGGSDYVAGDTVDVTTARLRIQTADHSYDLTTVEAELGLIADTLNAPDQYGISLFDPDGVLFYDASAPILDGDIAITLLGGKPPPTP